MCSLTSMIFTYMEILLGIILFFPEHQILTMTERICLKCHSAWLYIFLVVIPAEKSLNSLK